MKVPVSVQDVVVVVIRSSTGDFFVHQRRLDRSTFPGGYGLGAGGKVEPGEMVTVAAARELREETGLCSQPRRLFTLSYVDDMRHHVMHVYELVVDAVPLPNNDSEWSQSGWTAPQVVEELWASGMLSPDTAAMYRRYRDWSGSAVRTVTARRMCPVSGSAPPEVPV